MSDYWNLTIYGYGDLFAKLEADLAAARERIAELETERDYWKAYVEHQIIEANAKHDIVYAENARLRAAIEAAADEANGEHKMRSMLRAALGERE